MLLDLSKFHILIRTDCFSTNLLFVLEDFGEAFKITNNPVFELLDDSSLCKNEKVEISIVTRK